VVTAEPPVIFQNAIITPHKLAFGSKVP